ncbi:CBM35 domain-containing protein [Streptomyces sp. NPDC091272]|uniref:CBM35 domain-containing protein n=1 Tax=Streptomyces sp. NPDC091272 TaxID=3365981 RepID=UPI00382FE93A
MSRAPGTSPRTARPVPASVPASVRPFTGPAPAFVRSLVPTLLLALLCSLLYGLTATTAQAADGLLEAESAQLAGGAVQAADHTGHTGSGFVGGYTDGNKGRASTTFTVESAAAGNGSVRIRYANGTTANMTLSLYVNGAKVRQVNLPATANWDSWAVREEAVGFRKGANTVALTFTQDDSGNVNLDHLAYTSPDDTSVPSTLTHQAEDAFVSGGAARASSVTGYQGSGYVGGLDRAGARTVFSVQAATAKTYPLVLRYRTTDSNAATVTLTANGSPVRRLTLPAAAGAWADATTDVPLRAGLNTLTLRTESGDNGRLLLDGVAATGTTANATRGATLPYTSYEAEAGTTNGSTIGPDRTYLTVASESSARRAVVLDQTGEYVQFTLTRPANALTLRYSVPDNAAGTGSNATLSLYANGTQVRDLALTSKYSWVYGAYPYTNVPSQGSPHHFYDEVRSPIGSFPAGTVLRLQKDSGDSAASYTLDLLETETAPAAATMPSTGFVSAATLGVTAGDGSDDTNALNSALNTAKTQGKGLWLPAGTFNISGRINLAGVTLRGAGEWHTTIYGRAGKGGFFGVGGTSVVQDLTLDGDASVRDDSNSDAAFEGDFGNGSTLQNVWIEHSKVGLWIDAPTNGLLATQLRIRDTWADGVNLHKGTADTEVSQSSVRNTGDDGLAMFSEAQAVRNSSFRFNTVQLPMLANTAAIYGGQANRIEDNLLTDTVVASAGVAISSRFAPVPFSGTTVVARNTLTRTGGYEPNWASKFGALWIYADSSDITAPVLVQDNQILDSTYSGLLVSWQKNVSSLTVTGTRIDRTGLHGIEIQSAGSGNFSGVTVANTAAAALNVTGGFVINRGAGNSGW